MSGWRRNCVEDVIDVLWSVKDAVKAMVEGDDLACRMVRLHADSNRPLQESYPHIWAFTLQRASRDGIRMQKPASTANYPRTHIWSWWEIVVVLGDISHF